MIKHKVGSFILALSVVLSLTAVAPHALFGQMNKGIDLYNSWQYKEAEKAFREALKADPSNTLTNYYLGLCIVGQERFGEALDIFLKVKKSQDKADQRTRPAVPSEYQIQLALARARLGVKQYEEAWKNLESARIVDGRASDVYVYRGVYYFQQEKDKEALKELEKAISLDKNNPYAHYYSGLTYHHMGQAEKAVTALKAFLSLAPDAPEAGKAKMLVDQLC